MEALLASIWIVAVCSYDGSAGTIAYWVVATFAMIYPIHLILTGVATWARLKRSASIRLTSITILTPLVTLPVPFLLNQLNSNGPLLDSPQKQTTAIALLVGCAIMILLLQPRRCAQLLPVFVLESFGLNLLILLGMISLYLMPIGFLLLNWGALNSSVSTNEDGILLLAYGLGALAAYLMASTFPAALVLGYSGLSFFQSSFTKHRKWHIAQLIVSLPLVLIGGSILFNLWLRTK
ncbi:MAG: hypothetical protein ACSHX8_07355 [Opitutaceae bacterium]